MENIKNSIFTWVFIPLLCHFSKVEAQYTQTGMASYYASEFHGRRTASGEKYNMNDLTAAHPTLPFHTKVKVTNLKNNKSIIVRINDRGPHAKQRIIDLSKAAASEIGLIQAGVTRVRIEAIGEEKEQESSEKVPADAQEKKEETVKEATPVVESHPAEKEPIKEAPSAALEHKELKSGKFYDLGGHEKMPNGYGIQILSFSEKDKLIRQLPVLEKKYSEILVETAEVKGKAMYRILIGQYADKNIAKKELARLKKDGQDGLVRKYQK